MDNVGCVGTEMYLDQCPFSGWGSHDCTHGEDVGVSCEQVPTTTGTSSSAHAVEELTPSGTAPAVRSWHTVVWSDAADGIYVFGGYRWFDESRGFNDLYLYDAQDAGTSGTSWESSATVGGCQGRREML